MPKPLGLGFGLFPGRIGSGGPSVLAFTVGPQSGVSLPVAITLIEGSTPPTAIYIVGVTAGSAAPSATQIIAGQNGSGGAAAVAANIPVATSGLTNINVTPPATGTYDFYTVATDAAAARSNVASALAVAYVAYIPSTDLFGYQYSIDPSVIGTLFQDTAGTVPVTALGQSVACVRDPFNNAIVATQATAGNQPIYQQDAQGKFYLQLGDGVTNRWIRTATLNYTTSSFDRVLAVAAVRQDGRPAANTLLLRHGSGAGGFGIFAPLTTDTHSFLSRGSVQQNANAVFAGDTLPLKMTISGYTTIPNDLTVLRRDGTERARNTGDLGTGFFANAIQTIGAFDGTGSGPFNGRLYSLLVAATGARDFLDSDIAPAEAYANARLN